MILALNKDNDPQPAPLKCKLLGPLLLFMIRAGPKSSKLEQVYWSIKKKKSN